MPRETNVIVEFFIDAIRDGVASAEKGREVFKEVEMCIVRTVGDKDNNLVIRADEPFLKAPGGGSMMNAMERYPDHYAAFKNNETERVAGTALESLPFLGKAQIAELNYYGVKTAEQLAALGEAQLEKRFGWREWRTQAEVWISEADKSAIASKAQMENDDLKARLAALEAKMAKAKVAA